MDSRTPELDSLYRDVLLDHYGHGATSVAALVEEPGFRRLDIAEINAVGPMHEILLPHPRLRHSEYGRGGEDIQAYFATHFVDDLGLSIERVGLFLTLLQLGGLGGPLFFGWLSDRINRKGVIQVDAEAPMEPVGHEALHHQAPREGIEHKQRGELVHHPARPMHPDHVRGWHADPHGHFHGWGESGEEQPQDRAEPGIRQEEHAIAGQGRQTGVLEHLGADPTAQGAEGCCTRTDQVVPGKHLRARGVRRGLRQCRLLNGQERPDLAAGTREVNTSKLKSVEFDHTLDHRLISLERAVARHERTLKRTLQILLALEDI